MAVTQISECDRNIVSSIVIGEREGIYWEIDTTIIDFYKPMSATDHAPCLLKLPVDIPLSLNSLGSFVAARSILIEFEVELSESVLLPKSPLGK